MKKYGRIWRKMKKYTYERNSEKIWKIFERNMKEYRSVMDWIRLCLQNLSRTQVQSKVGLQIRLSPQKVTKREWVREREEREKEWERERERERKGERERDFNITDWFLSLCPFYSCFSSPSRPLCLPLPFPFFFPTKSSFHFAELIPKQARSLIYT
jgi:hypothetical protein